jgi:hypothetical protein
VKERGGPRLYSACIRLSSYCPLLLGFTVAGNVTDGCLLRLVSCQSECCVWSLLNVVTADGWCSKVKKTYLTLLLQKTLFAIF